MPYPILGGKKVPGVLPDYESPLNIEADKGDKDVPDNDQAGMSRFAKGGEPPDPNGFITPFGKNGK